MNNNATKSLMKIRMILWIIVSVAIIGAGALFWYQSQSKPGAGFDGPFELQSTLGGNFNRDDLTNIPSLVLFGFTSCPDVCPATLAQMITWRDELDVDENTLRLIFVSIDPDRDNREIMQEYLARFSTPVIGLTGTVEQVETAKLSFGVFGEKVINPDASEEEKANYDMDHTASVLMFGRDGFFAGTINFEDDLANIMNKINRLISN
ncbi:MAG: SCO family protein [Devosiaceae bacterium]|nr:SCO family protein [Devosiaceae bacterium]